MKIAEHRPFLFGVALGGVVGLLAGLAVGSGGLSPLAVAPGSEVDGTPTVAQPSAGAPPAESCPVGQVFSRGLTPPWDEGRCIPRPPQAAGSYRLPLEHADGVVCTHSPVDDNRGPGNDFTKIGSHAYRNTLFAVDLASPGDVPATVVAARPGTVARAFSDCSAPPDATSNVDDCGAGFGNNVVLDHGDGEVSLYAHLTSVAVAQGQVVGDGTVLGTEGFTGMAGKRHLHFSVNRPDGPLAPSGISSSVPYSFVVRTMRDGASSVIAAEDLPCRFDDRTGPLLFR